VEPTRVIEILQDGKSRGSGYLIAPRQVLTARHVPKPPVVGTDCLVHLLRGTDELAIPSAQEPRPPPVPAKVGWVSAEHDFALIEITGDPLCSPKTGLLPFGEVPADGIARQIVGSGFPEAAGADQRTIIGTLAWVLAGGRRFDIDVISTIPRDWRKWGGFSGAAIFAGSILVGVVRTVDENWNGGVLEATPTAWLLEDNSFKKYLEKVNLSLPIRIDVGAADGIMPLDFEADVSIEGTLRFSPRNPRVPFLGREAALKALDEFLNAERKRPFAWWLVTGGGGAGKTRLARELCLRMRRQGWRAGFLPSSFVADTAALDAWCPRVPTLIVADYVMKRIEEIRKLAARVARRDGLLPLRLLLLEREASTWFENQFLGTDQSDRGVIERARYQFESLSLSELTEDEVWSLVEACPWRLDSARVPLTRNEFFQRLSELDSQRRPLVAMILADALATSSAGTALGGLETILHDLIQRDRDHLWPKELGVAKTPVGKTEADIAIAFATMIDGLGPPELEAIRVARGKPIDREILPACRIAIGKPLGSVPLLGRLEPDLIGEFFALETLSDDPNNLFANPLHSWMPKAAWRACGSGMFDFVGRAKQTFPDHPAIQQVDITVVGVRESWLLAAFGILSRANDLVEGFDDVHKWMRPHAHSDAGAALAFADVSMLATTFVELNTVGPPPGVLIALYGALGELLLTHLGEPTLHEPIARAFINTGVKLGVARGLLSRVQRVSGLSEEITVCDDVLARFGAVSELSLREPIARTLVNKGIRLGPSEEAIAVYDDVLARFGTAHELPLREEVARALFNKGAALGHLGRSEEAIAVYDEVLARFSTAHELPLREEVAHALVNKGVALGALGRSQEAIAVYDEVLARFSTAHELPLREEVAHALVNKGAALRGLGRSEEAIAVYDEVLARFSTAGEPSFHMQVTQALRMKGDALDDLGRSEEASAVYDNMVKRDIDLIERVNKALVIRAKDLKLSTRILKRHNDMVKKVEPFSAARRLPLSDVIFTKFSSLRNCFRKS
jgi:tetratricopeptide (TPR) repeat protein